MDFREKILKEGTLKHRQTSYARPKWKTRHVVFKISGGGRLQFIIYKESPTSPANEVKEIPIEEYGGLESTAKLDSEKNVFSVITTNMTDTFATDSSEDLQEWTQLLQEYLGKELTFGVMVPQKQGQVKSGRAILRIRNTGFTITTCDSPPRCMGTWQIIHIRKFGGTDSFKFQTGSKCPSGEMLYTLHTDDNATVKSLFNDLSQHKPIFCDDRVGRRMTLERSYNHHGPFRQSPSRFSLQSTPGREREGHDSLAGGPTYENKEAITEAAQRFSKQICLPPVPPTRRHSSNEDRAPLPHMPSQQHSQNSSSNATSSPLSPTKLDDQRLYQNIPGRPGNAPHSPTKHRGRYPIPHSEPVPDGYYNVSPPLALKKYPPNAATGGSPPRLSPEEEASFFSEFAPVPPPPIRTVSSTSSAPQTTYSDSYVMYNQLLQRPTVMIEGDNLVVQRTPNGHVWGPGGEGEAGKDETTMYQNLEFMKLSGNPSTASAHVEDSHSGTVVSNVGQPLPIIADLDTQTESHNYTNVEFALESVHGRSVTARTLGKTSSKQLARAGDVRRKISAPPLNRDRSGAMSYRDPSTATPTDSSTAVTSNLSVSLHPKLRSSLSSHDLQQSERATPNKGDLLPEYYNLFVPRLPAHRGGGGGVAVGGAREGGTDSLEAGKQTLQATLSDFPTSSSATCTPSTTTSTAKHPEIAPLKEEGTDMVDFATHSTPQQDKMARLAEHSEEDDDEEDKVLVTPNVPAGNNWFDGSGSQTKAQSLSTPQYDHLELVRTETGTQTTRFSPGPSPSPENLSRGNTPRPSMYDQLPLKEPSPPKIEKKDEKDDVTTEDPSHLQPQTAHPNKYSLPYERKVVVVGHTHTYEYIEVSLRGEGGGGNGESRVPGPEVSVIPRHNSDPGRSDSGTEPAENDASSQNHNRFSLREQDSNVQRSPNTQLQSRRKPLPLQAIPLDESFDANNRQVGSKGQQNEQQFDVPLPKPRKSVTTSSTSSAGSDTSAESDGVQQSPSVREQSHSPVQLLPKIPPKHARQKSDEVPNSDPAPSVAHLPPPTHSVSDHVTSSSHKMTSPEEVRSHDENSAVPLRPKDPSIVTVNLPVAEIQFDKPLIPPKPRVLENKHALIQRTKVKSPPGDNNDLNYTQVFPRPQWSPSAVAGASGASSEGYRDRSKVVYQSINFEVTEGLRKTREDVENQRSREIEWLEQREQSLKTLVAK